MSAGWLVKVKRIRGKKLPLTAGIVHALRDEYTLLANPAAEWTRPALSANYLPATNAASVEAKEVPAKKKKGKKRAAGE